MSQSPFDDEEEEPPASRNLSIAGIMLVMFIVCVMASAGYYVFRGVMGQDFAFGDFTTGDASSSGQFIFILFTLSVPLLLMIVFSLIAGVVTWLRDRQ